MRNAKRQASATPPQATGQLGALIQPMAEMVAVLRAIGGECIDPADLQPLIARLAEILGEDPSTVV